MRKLLSHWLAVWLCLLAASSGFAAEPHDAAAIMPAGAVAFVEIDGLESWIDKLQQSEFVKSLPSNPQVQAFYASPQGRQADAGRKILEAQIGMDLWTLAKKGFGGRIAAAFYPVDGRKEPNAVLFVRATDAATLEKLREKAAPFLALAQDRIVTSVGPGDVSVRSIDNKLFLAEKDDWILAASTSELLTTALTLRTDMAASVKSLSADVPFVAMTKQMGDKHLARVFFNAEMVAKAQGGRIGPEKLDNPLGSLLLGGMFELFSRSSFAGLTLDLTDGQLRLTAGTAGQGGSLGASYQPFFAPKNQGAAALPAVPGLIGGVTLNRDYAGWYKNREALLQAKVLPEFDKFESGLANLLPGRDFGEDVLPTIGRNLTVVAAPQSFEHLQSNPGVQLPGFGLIVDLAKPKEGEEIMQLLFQTLTVISNLNAGQQGRQPWVLSSETYHGTQINFGKYTQKPKGDRLPIVFNFMPASARVGDKFVLCSSVDLCRQLVDAYSGKPAASGVRAATADDFRIELRGELLSQALAANAELLEARSVQEGKSAEQAKAEIGTLLQLVRSIQSVSLKTGAAGEGYNVQLDANWGATAK